MKIAIKKNSISVIILLFLISLSKGMFGLIDLKSEYLGLKITNIIRAIFILFIAYILLKYRGNKIKYNYSKYIYILLICVFISMLQQKFIINQPIILTLKEQVSYMIMLCMYFPLKKFIILSKLNSIDILRGLLYLGTFSSLLYISEKILYIGTGISFLSVSIGLEGSFSVYRLYIGSSLVIISAINSIYFYTREKKLSYMLYYIINIATLIWISQSRLELISISIITFIGIMLYSFRKKNVIVLFGVVLSGSMVLLLSNIQEVIYKIFKLGEYSVTGDTLSIREYGRELYFSILTESNNRLVFGVGYPSREYFPAEEFYGFKDNIYLSDNGIYSILFIHGLVGVVTVVLLFLSYFKKAYKVYKNTGNTIFLLYITSLVIVMQNMVLWFFDSDGTLLFVLMIVLLELTYEEYNLVKSKGRT